MKPEIRKQLDIHIRDKAMQYLNAILLNKENDAEIYLEDICEIANLALKLKGEASVEQE